MLADFALEIIIGLGIPACAAAGFVIRHFIRKEKCFALMQQRLEHLEEENASGKKSHKELYEKIDEVNVKMAKVETAVDMIAKKLD